jgi:hypothetical protein
VNAKFPLAGAALALALAFGASGAQAGNLLVNGDFETGDFTGWNVNDPGNNTHVWTAIDGLYAQSGSYFAALGAVGCCGTLSQTVADTAGQSLVLNYYFRSDGGTPNYFEADWNGVLIAGSAVSGASASGYVDYQFKLTATGSDTLTFLEQDDPGFGTLDNVSLTSAVPEPATWAMLILGVAMVGFAARRRREGMVLAA